MEGKLSRSLNMIGGGRPTEASVPRGRRRPRPRDVGLVVLATALDVLGFSAVLSVDPVAGAVIVAYALAGHAALAWRSSAPVTVFTILWVHSIAAYVIVPDYGPIVGLLIALFTVAARVPGRTGLVALVSTAVPSILRILHEVAGTPETTAGTVVVTVALLLTMINGGVWGAGRWSLLHRERTVLLERDREHSAREAVTRERVRIAQDLHDIISHSVSVMSLQAAGAQSLIQDRPERAEQALGDIQASGAQAMVELRRLLAVLRADERGPVPAAEGQGGFADLDELLRGVRAAGIPARLTATGLARELDPGVGLTVYRIAQEALTNVAVHAGPGVDTEVNLAWRDADVVVDVRNVAPTRPPAPGIGRGGRGLIGMHERVTAMGGTIRSGPAPDGGFRVTATIPTPPPEPPTTSTDVDG